MDEPKEKLSQPSIFSTQQVVVQIRICLLDGYVLCPVIALRRASRLGEYLTKMVTLLILSMQFLISGTEHDFTITIK